MRNAIMKAVQILGSKGSHTISLTRSAAKPIPQGSHILIQTAAAGITADEVNWPELYASPSRIPGHDISGVIDSFGPSYAGPLKVGDSVFAMLKAESIRGGQAEYCVALPEEVARKPNSISHAAAAALPIPVLTAWEGLFKHAKIKKGDTVFVTGASGAVGSIVVQIASKIVGAEVVALASKGRHDELIELGAARCLDYNEDGWEEGIKGVDVVYDAVGGDMLDKAWGFVKRDGTIVSVGDPTPDWAFGEGQPKQQSEYPDVKCVYFVVESDGESLGKISTMLEEGKIKPLAVQGFGIGDAAEAWAHAGKRGRQGKVVIVF